MQIGGMNHPQRDVLGEIRWMAEMGLDFVDLTLEPPAAAHWRTDLGRIRAALQAARLGIVGHTAYYLPLGSPFEELRAAAVRELQGCLRSFAELGARLVNVHPDRYAPHHDHRFAVERNLLSLRTLLDTARELGLTLMIENLPGDFNTAAQLGELLDPLPELGLHLDIGHANLLVTQNTAPDILHSYGPRLRHVHLHDNKGGADDLHLPLGAGTLDLALHLAALWQAGYDGTITLEVFTPDRRYLACSRDLLRGLWDHLHAGPGAAANVESQRQTAPAAPPPRP